MNVGIVSNDESKVFRYILGAVNVQNVTTEEQNLGLKLNITLAEHNMVIDTNDSKYQDINYKASYYVVKDLAIYRLKNIKVYDEKQDGGIFNWDNKTLSPTEKNISFKMSGLLGDISQKQVDRIDNYVGISFFYKDLRTGEIVTTNETTKSAKLNINLLTSDEYKLVDADKKNGITDDDKKFVANELERLANILASKEKDKNDLLYKYENAIRNREQLKQDYEEAEIELELRYNNYLAEEQIKFGKLQSITNAKNDLKTMERQLEDDEKQIKQLQAILEQKEQNKQQADNNLVSISEQLLQLENEYKKALEEREKLKEQANCQDTVEEDIYIYLEPNEKDALEKCKEYKQQYEENIDNRVVEIALDTLNNFNSNNYNSAYQQSIVAAEELEIARINVEEKNNEISTLREKIRIKDITINMMNRFYESYIQDVYTPIKSAYEDYLAGEYENIKNAYMNDINNNVVENIKEQLDKATVETQQAKDAYDNYVIYKETFDKYFDEYKAMYELYMSLIDADMKTIAEKLGLNIKIRVQDMGVSIKNGKDLSSIYKQNPEPKTYEMKLSTYFNMNNFIAKTGKPEIRKELYSGIENTELTIKDYKETFNISKDILNGVRKLSGKVEYDTTVEIGTKENAKNMVDTMYNAQQSNDKKTVIFKLNKTTLTKEYKVNESAETYKEKYKDVKPINIYTPITVTAKLVSDDTEIVDQTQTSEANSTMIQVNVPFTITLDNGKAGTLYNRTFPYDIDNTQKYRDGYYIKFDFDVHKVYINGKRYKKGDVISKDTWISVNKPTTGEPATIVAQAYGNNDDAIGIVSEETGSYTVRAYAYNATDIMVNKSIGYSTILKMIAENSGMDTLLYNICDTSSYFAEEKYEVNIINRLYDFKVTDVKDVNWKNVFRKSTSNTVNSHTGTVYYSGTTKWDTKSDKSNDISNRTPSEIGKSPLRILPIGPYKNANASYIKAPKLGYRFSFDFKITGSYYTKINDKNDKLEPNENKTIKIITKFYYISKDGKDYYSEFDGTNEGISLFYKTSSGKYVRIDEKGGGYKLTFTPNDGYRYIEDTDTTNLSNKQLVIGNLRELNLTYEMATPTSNRAATTYYGEYKLPNSTIAVKTYKDKNGNIIYDINNPLTNGYIGVVFDIVAQNNGMSLEYSKKTQSDKENTSQWDYEGYLGYTKYGKKIEEEKPLIMRLEKGSWKIDNKTYNEIKGSVILYDIDERAATDYE